jgi:hypothetical protein
VALASFGKEAGNIIARLMDGFIDLSGALLREDIVRMNDTDGDGNYEEAVLETDVTRQLKGGDDFDIVDTDGVVQSNNTASSVSVNGSDETVVVLGTAVSTDYSSGTYLGEFEGDTWQSLGHVQDVSPAFTPVTRDADVAGREKQVMVDVEATVVLEQTTGQAFEAVSEIVRPRGLGSTIKLTDQKTAYGNVGSADGLTFENVFPAFEGEFDGSGEGSTFTISIEGRVPIGQFTNFNGTLTLDA